MRVFIDTSAFLSILDADDKFHRKARSKWAELITSEVFFFSNNYILVETFALVQHCFGMKAVRAYNDDILSLINIEWVDETTRKAGVSALEVAGRRRLSLVDCVSFETMRQLGIKTAFTFDHHFATRDLSVFPDSPLL